MQVAVSRLHWDDGTVPTAHYEIPHVRGVPVRSSVPEGADVHLFAPNRLGIAEVGDGSDSVHPRNDLQSDLISFRKLLRRLSQIPGVTPTVEPEMPCSVLLTPGVDPKALEAVTSRFPGSVGTVPSRLAEFPGGLQVVANRAVEARFDEFADTLEDCLTKELR